MKIDRFKIKFDQLIRLSGKKKQVEKMKVFLTQSTNKTLKINNLTTKISSKTLFSSSLTYSTLSATSSKSNHNFQATLSKFRPNHISKTHFYQFSHSYSTKPPSKPKLTHEERLNEYKNQILKHINENNPHLIHKTLNSMINSNIRPDISVLNIILHSLTTNLNNLINNVEISIEFKNKLNNNENEFLNNKNNNNNNNNNNEKNYIENNNENFDLLDENFHLNKKNENEKLIKEIEKKMDYYFTLFTKIYPHLQPNVVTFNTFINFAKISLDLSKGFFYSLILFLIFLINIFYLLLNY